MKQELICIPNLSIGPFTFGTVFSKSDYTFEFISELCEEDDITQWDSHEIDKLGLCIYVNKEAIIESISAEKELFLDDFQILGLPFLKFLSFINSKPTEAPDSIYMSDEELQNVYEFDDFGLQVWCSDGIIVKVFLS